MVKVLFIGDIIGDPGVQLTLDLLPRIKYDYKVDISIANAENANAGKGITSQIVRKLKEGGIDVITTGNHVWDNQSITALNEERWPLLRPANYPEGNPGRGYGIFETEHGVKFAVINLQARSFMQPIDCPFRKAEELLPEIRKQTSFTIVDFHGETTAEKQTLGWYLDGKISAVIGTHTHVQTADERILPNGTGYITDVGMTGPFDSVIGMRTDIAVKRFIYQVPEYYAMAKSNVKLNGVLLELDSISGKTKKIERLNFSKANYGKQ